jgi:tRNA A-37 threonylcarbamoyl transferase component Bud32
MSDQRRSDLAASDDRSGSVVVRRLRVEDRDLVAKSGTGRARARLRLEADVLDQLRTAPVAHLVALRESDERTDLVTVDAGTHDLTWATARDPREGVAVLAAAAHAVDRLHAAGWAHGALCAEHMVVSDDGAVTLCSLGSATRCSARPSAVGEDVQALVQAMRAVTERVDPAWTIAQRWHWRRTARRVRRVLGEHSTSAPTRPSGRPAQQLGRQLERVVAHRTGPDRVRPRPTLLDTTSVRLLGPVLCFAAVLIVLGLLRPPTGAADGHAATADTSTSTAATGGAVGTAASRPTTGACGSAPTGAALDTDGDGCAELVEAEGNLLRIGDTTLRAGAPGDVVTAAPPDCGAPAAVLSLRPSTGEVFLFGELPRPGAPVTARIVATIAGATSLEVQHEPCTRAAIRLADGPTVALADARLDPTATTALAPDGATATTPSEEPGP